MKQGWSEQFFSALTNRVWPPTPPKRNKKILYSKLIRMIVFKFNKNN